MTNDPQRVADDAVRDLTSRLGIDHIDLALVLGSGWSSGADELGVLLGEVELGSVPGFAKPVVAGHGGRLLVVRTGGGKVAAVFTGRTTAHSADGSRHSRSGKNDHPGRRQRPARPGCRRPGHFADGAR